MNAIDILEIHSPAPASAQGASSIVSSSRMTYQERQRAINEACFRHTEQAKTAWNGVVQRTGIQSAAFWPIHEIERFLDEINQQVDSRN